MNVFDLVRLCRRGCKFLITLDSSAEADARERLVLGRTALASAGWSCSWSWVDVEPTPEGAGAAEETAGGQEPKGSLGVDSCFFTAYDLFLVPCRRKGGSALIKCMVNSLSSCCLSLVHSQPASGGLVEKSVASVVPFFLPGSSVLAVFLWGRES